MTGKQNDPAHCVNGEQGQTAENQNYGHCTNLPARIKSLIVEAASRGFIPPSWATLALRVLYLVEA
jgi:hypothetical protein